MSFIYEIETRFSFNNEEDIYEKFPFIKSCLELKVEWETTHYGIDLFKKDIIIRISNAKINNKKVKSLGFKEADFGQKLNIRKEYSEKITNGIIDSEILTILGARNTFDNCFEIENELKSLGHNDFMSFSGVSLLGKCKDLDIDFKIMHCKSLKYPLLLEIEKKAKSSEQIEVKENELLDFVKKYNLQNEMIRNEPPTLLYQTIK